MSTAPLNRTWIDLEALYAALHRARLEREMSWRQVAIELDLAPSFFTRLRDGSKPDSENLCLLTDWLGNGTSVADFQVPHGTRAPGLHMPSDDELYGSLPDEVVARINAAELDDR
jgi:hypothetical protein